MKKNKILLIVGNRPQYIKGGIIYNKLKKSKSLNIKVLDTNQHYDKKLSQYFYNNFKYRSDYNLKIGSHSNEVAIAQIIKKLSFFFKKNKFDAAIILGDTNTTAAAAICLSHIGLTTFHVEAGERIYRKVNSPEEINRLIADQCSDYLLTCSIEAQKNLKKEGFAQNKYKFVGDPMLDIFLDVSKKLKRKKSDFNFPYCYASIHRKENTQGAILLNLLNLLDQGKLQVILPIHPRVKKEITRIKWKPKKNLKIIDPVDYVDSIKLLINSKIVFTDSGGLKREAFFAKKKCISPQTGSPLWPVTVKYGWNKTINPKNINLMKQSFNFFPKPKKHNLKSFGNGKAAENIAKTIQLLLNEKK